ncbi:MAG TPA: tetratricopeptide repeat protein, partial [Pyrinomonadaceae bacterium]|nr:tetratricopeptide repeat protein [Pyrinomonadaceae bacterium]
MTSLKLHQKTINSIVVCLLAVLVAGPSIMSRVRAQGDEAQLEIVNGRDFARRHRYEDALKSFKHANELRSRNCAECLLGMAQAYEGLNAYKNVVDSCDKVIELGTPDKQLIANAYNLKGMALIELAERKDQKKLQDAESTLRQGIAVNPDVPNLHYNLGFALMQENRDADGAAELKKYLELSPNSDNSEEARKLIE